MADVYGFPDDLQTNRLEIDVVEIGERIIVQNQTRS